MSVSPNDRSYRIIQNSAAVSILCVLLAGCNLKEPAPKSTVQMIHVPPAGPGGPERMETIEGRVIGAKPGQQIVVYAKTDLWWVQPFWGRPLTAIEKDGSWKSSTHLGSEYAALLVEPGFHSEKQMTALPSEGNGIVTELSVKGEAAEPNPLKTIHFGGYDWVVRSGASDRGGEINAYDPENVWTDDKGYLHLRMGEQNGHWSCAEVNLTRSLGYGTYKFVVQNTSQLEPSGVLGMFTLDERRNGDTRIELDIELSQWGKPGGKNGQYVVQPYYVPGNVARFLVPPGKSTHTLLWSPGSASFKTVQGSGEKPGGRTIEEHVFTSGIPVPAAEVVHINLFDFYHSKSNVRRTTEVVIEKFVYIP